jgi:hypothetical protein
MDGMATVNLIWIGQYEQTQEGCLAGESQYYISNAEQKQLYHSRSC